MPLMRHHFKLAVVWSSLSSFLQAPFPPLGYMRTFQQALTHDKLHFPGCGGLCSEGQIPVPFRRATWLNEQCLKMHRGNAALEEMNSKCYGIAGNYFIMTFTGSAHFPTSISLIQRKTRKPQSVKGWFLVNGYFAGS